VTDPQAGGQLTEPVRVRFAPAPSGHLRIGDVRAALYAWAFARHTGGAFVLRIEDTDTAQVTAEHVAAAQETLHWLGLAWDEGPDQGGPYAPYQASERVGLYHQWAQRFLDTGQAYWCYCSPEELQARRDQTGPAAAEPPPADYDRYCRTLTQEQAEAYLAEGRRPVVRLRVPDEAITFTDVIRGPVTVQHPDVPDFVLMHGDGHPLPTLTTAVDDAMMRITHVIRDEDELPFTPRHVALHRAMGLPEDQFPVFAHLPAILGEDGQTLSRRNGVISIDWYRQQGFLPEALCAYLAQLGWSPADATGAGGAGGAGDAGSAGDAGDAGGATGAGGVTGAGDAGSAGDSADGPAELTLDDLVGRFELAQVSPVAVPFDPAKLEAINAVKIRGLTPADLARRIGPFLARAGLVTEPLSSDQMWFIRDGAPLIQDRMTRLTEAPALLAFLLVPESGFHPHAEDAAAVLTADAATPLKAAVDALTTVTDWTAPAIEQALRTALADSSGPEPGPVFDPVRVAVTGRRIAPPLFDSMAVLGRDRCLARLAAAQSTLPG
jgi:glutamyl-tRNA synthetase